MKKMDVEESLVKRCAYCREVTGQRGGRIVKGKYALLLALKSFDYELTHLGSYARQSADCYELLESKLDALCRFILREDNRSDWSRWGELDELKGLSAQLRHTSSQALGELEKFQSRRLLERREYGSEYWSLLSSSVREELEDYAITGESRVLFVGSGSLPLSALTIARQTGAALCCLDIDQEAAELGARVVETAGLLGRCRVVSSYAEALDWSQQATHVFIASLVERKCEVVEQLECCIPREARIIVRYGNGLKSLFNYPLLAEFGPGWQAKPLSRSDRIYDTLLLTSVTDEVRL